MENKQEINQIEVLVKQLKDESFKKLRQANRLKKKRRNNAKS